MFSLGIDPSTTSTYGASSLPSAASRNGFMNSSPPSVGESTLLCRCTFGRPGTNPMTTSSMAGESDAVIDTVSPSQLIPSEIQRMCTSSTPSAAGLVAVSLWLIARPSVAGCPVLPTSVRSSRRDHLGPPPPRRVHGGLDGVRETHALLDHRRPAAHDEHPLDRAAAQRADQV